MKKQSLIKGSIILGLAGIIAKFLGFFFRWPLIMLIGDTGIGYYQLSYPLYMFFVAMASGVPIAISKMISEKNAVGDIEGSYEVVKESVYLMATLGTVSYTHLDVYKRQLKIVYDEVDRLARLVNDLLDMSAMESGKFNLAITEFDINQVISLCILNLEHKIQEKGLNVKATFYNNRAYAVSYTHLDVYKRQYQRWR